MKTFPVIALWLSCALFGYAVTAQAGDGDQILMAAADGDTATATDLLKKNLSLANFIGKNGVTPLILAAKGNHPAMVRLLLEYRAKVNDKDSTRVKASALHYAAIQGYTEVVVLLINAKADVNITNADNMTPLMNASYKGYRDVVQLLLDAKADFSLKSKNDKTALILARETRKVAVVELLRKYGAKE